MKASLYSLENQQTASPLQGQTQQVQRIWAAGHLSSQLGGMVLLRGGDGEWPWGLGPGLPAARLFLDSQIANQITVRG